MENIQIPLTRGYFLIDTGAGPQIGKSGAFPVPIHKGNTLKSEWAEVLMKWLKDPLNLTNKSGTRAVVDALKTWQVLTR